MGHVAAERFELAQLFSSRFFWQLDASYKPLFYEHHWRDTKHAQGFDPKLLRSDGHVFYKGSNSLALNETVSKLMHWTGLSSQHEDFI